MEFCALASGSSGNCIYVSGAGTALLIDAGISVKKICEGLESLGVRPESIEALLVTHDHTDHIQGAAAFSRKYGCKLYGSGGTLAAILKGAGATFDRDLMVRVEPDSEFTVGGITIEAFAISHDASEPVSYTLRAEGKKLGMATDLGEYTDYTVAHLADSDALYIESNYDTNMLMCGKYPYALKRRIDSKSGHLSNDMSAELILKLQHRNLRHIVLAHLSKDNNFEELAYETVNAAIEQGWLTEEKPDLRIAHRYTPTGMITL